MLNALQFIIEILTRSDDKNKAEDSKRHQQIFIDYLKGLGSRAKPALMDWFINYKIDEDLAGEMADMVLNGEIAKISSKLFSELKKRNFPDQVVSEAAFYAPQTLFMIANQVAIRTLNSEDCKPPMMFIKLPWRDKLPAPFLKYVRETPEARDELVQRLLGINLSKDDAVWLFRRYLNAVFYQRIFFTSYC